MVALTVAAAVAVLIIAYIGMYNGLIRLRNKVDEAYATMDAHLKKRYDLIPNLVEIVKGYAAHEKETLEAVEDDILQSRKYYNAVVRDLNTSNDVFPKSIVANMAAIGKREYFEIDGSERGNVKISF